jgi:hypothetical protein
MRSFYKNAVNKATGSDPTLDLLREATKELLPHLKNLFLFNIASIT